MNKLLVITTLVVMVMGTGLKGCDKPAGSDQGDSAGNNQPDNVPELCDSAVSGIGGEKPIGQIEASKILYDVYVELLDADCANVIPMGGELIDFYITGNITKQDGLSYSADYTGGSAPNKKVNSPYHLTAFVEPANAPHDMVVIAGVNSSAIKKIHELDEAEFLRCRILRNRAPITVAKGSSDRVVDTKIIQAPYAQVNCHFSVGVG